MNNTAVSDEVTGNNISDNSGQSGVEVFIEDVQGNPVGAFFAEDEKSFFEMAEEHDIELPISCASGACFVCACKVKEGQENIDIGKLSVPLVDVEEDQVLTCVGGVISDMLTDGNYHKIVLQKLM